MSPSRRPWLSLAALWLAACSEPPTMVDQTPREPVPSAQPASPPAGTTGGAQPAATAPTAASPAAAHREIAVFGNGCFWCSEAVLEQLDGVLDVTSGYAGGDVKNPTYEEVCTGMTGHAEVVQVTFDPARISYAQLLDWFFQSHDPTTRNRQGNDIGTQYRSVIFYQDEAQQQTALAAIQKAQPKHRDRIVTQVVPAATFYAADEHHQDYFRNHPTQGYCRMVIAPKLHKLGLDSNGKVAAPDTKK